MAADDRTAAIPYANWSAEESDLQLAKPGSRPISLHFRTSIDSGSPGPPYDESFSTTYVKNVGELHTPSFKVVHHNTDKEVKAIATESGKTSHPLRCVSLVSYQPLDAPSRLYAAIFIENTGAQAKQWYWWFNVSADFLVAETDEKKKDKPGYPLRLVHLSPTSYPVGEAWKFDAIAVSNAGANWRWWWWNYNMKLEEVQQLLNDHQAHNPRVYQLANGNVSLQNHNIWTAILAESGGGKGWYEHDKTFDQLKGLAKQRNARILDLVPNYTLHSGNSGYAATMLKCV